MEKEPLSVEDRRAIMLAAISSTPADATSWDSAVAVRAAAITAMVAPGGKLDKLVSAVNNAKVFTGTVVSVEKEVSSTRAIVTLDTGTTQAREGVAPGCEIVRTERTDNALGLAVALQARKLMGKKVVVWVNVEEVSNNRKVRVLVHIQAF